MALALASGFLDKTLALAGVRHLFGEHGIQLRFVGGGLGCFAAEQTGDGAKIACQEERCALRRFRGQGPTDDVGKDHRVSGSRRRIAGVSERKLSGGLQKSAPFVCGIQAAREELIKLLLARGR